MNATERYRLRTVVAAYIDKLCGSRREIDRRARECAARAMAALIRDQLGSR